MSEVSDYKSSPFDLYPAGPTVATTFSGTATPPGPGLAAALGDTSLDALCGVRFNTSDGRQVTVIRNGAVAIANSGLLMQAPAGQTGLQGLAITVPAATPATAGTYQVLVTNGSTVLNQNQFAFGYLQVQTNTGAGQMLQIASHQPAANGGKFIVTLLDPIQVTLDATTTVGLVPNPYIGSVVAAHGSLTAYAVGASMYAITATTAGTFSGTTGAQTVAPTPVYAMIVTRGPASLLGDADSITVGYPVGISDLTDGAVGVATLTTQPQIGIAMQAIASAAYGPVYLQL